MLEIIQLTIWDAPLERLRQRLDIATTNSVGADFLGLLIEVDESIDRLLPADRLNAAGEAIRRLGEIYAERSAMQLSEIGYLFRPEQEPVIPLDALVGGASLKENRYVRQSMMVDLEQFIETPELPEYDRKYNLTVVRERSKAEILAEIGAIEEVDLAATYQQTISLAHDENVSEWGAAISLCLDKCGRSVSLLELQKSIEMPLVQVWLGILLNEFEIEQRGEFYDIEQVWII